LSDPRPDRTGPLRPGLRGRLSRAGPSQVMVEPELMDLRLHTPRPDVVIVRVSGKVDRLNALLLAELAGKQLHRAPHVVIELGEVKVLGQRGLTVLRMLHQQAMARGRELHIVAAEHGAIRRSSHVTGLAELLSPELTADAVIARLPDWIKSPASSSPR